MLLIIKYTAGESFHHQYQHLYEHIVLLALKDGTTMEGGYYDDFYEDETILLSVFGGGVTIINMSDIQNIELSKHDSHIPVSVHF